MTASSGTTTYTLDNATANKGSGGGDGWTNFHTINDAAGTVNFGTGGSVGGNVTAATLDNSSYASAVTYDIANGANATTGIGGTHTGVTTLTGNGANAATNTVQGGATYTLDNATANKGGDGTVSWTGFGALNAGTSVVFGTGGSVAGSVTAPTLDFSSYVGAISATVTGANAGTVSHVGGSFSGVTR